MTGFLAWFARNGVAANLLMWLIILGGLMSLRASPKEVFPEVPYHLVNVAVEYLGAAPEEVEKAVCARIEERVQDLEVVKRVRSVAAEGLGTVTLELLPGADVRKAIDDVKARIDTIDTFPEEAEKPLIQEVSVRKQVLSIVISGPSDERTLKRLGERVRDEILALGFATQVELMGVRPEEIAIEVSERMLRRHNIRLADVAEAIRRSSVDVPGGILRTEGGEILVRTEGQVYLGRGFEDLVLFTRLDGTRLTVGDVATVVDGFAETDRAARMDGKPAVMVRLFRVGKQDVTEISRQTRRYLERVRPQLPEGVDLSIWQDDSLLLRGRFDTLISNGLAGLALVILVLAIFLKLRLASWVSLGIVISFLGAFWLMPLLDVTINVHSLFALLIVLGIVVDDAIVIGESIYRRLELGETGADAAIAGVSEVAVPVVFSVLTTIAAFVPLLMVSGEMGHLLRIVPIVVISTLMFSLVESLLILPAHLSKLQPERKQIDRGRGRLRWERTRGWLADRWRRTIRGYDDLLSWALAWRYLTAALAVSLLLLTLGVVAGGRLRFSFFPAVEADNLVAFLTMPQGTPRDETIRALARLEDSAAELREQLVRDGVRDPVRHLATFVGEQPSSSAEGLIRLAAAGSTSHLGEVNIELEAADRREISAMELTRRWRELSGSIPDVVELSFEAALFSAGAAIDIQLGGSDLNDLRDAAEKLKTGLRRYPGVVDVTDSLRRGKQEVKLAIRPEAEALGLRLVDLGRQVRQAFYGEEAQRVQRGRDEIKVMVRYPESARRSLADLEALWIRTPQGDEIPFYQAGEMKIVRGFASIERTDRSRTVHVTAGVDPEIANSNEILADVRRTVLPELAAAYRGLSYSLQGEQQQQRDAMGSLLRGFGLALFLIYALLAIPFRSYSQPFIVMVAIPFGIIGAIWGHVAMHQELTVISVFGIVALGGVVVNDTLILVDFINRRVRDGEPLHDAVRQAGKQRFRPIILTSLTTFVGLLPLMLESSVQAQFLIPMGISLAFGVLFATTISLILVPVSYLILEDLKRTLRLVGR